MICRSKKPKGRKGKTLFIDAVHEIAQKGTQSFLQTEHQSRILAAYKAFESETEFAHVATTAEIIAKGGNLTVHHHVVRQPAVSVEESTESLVENWERFETGGREFWMGMDELVEMLDGNVTEEANDA